MSKARNLADLVKASGDIKKEHLDEVKNKEVVKKLQTKFGLNLGVTEYMEKK